MVFLLSLFWRGAWHIRLEEVQISMRKEHRDSVPAKSIPRQGLANMPRQGIGKRSQAGNWQSVPGRDCKTCPGRALANVPRQGTGKRFQAGNWQASQAGTANVPRQGTGKCSQAGNRRRPQAGDSGCSHAGNCRHCTSLAPICHQPRGATPPPTSRVLCDELACLLTGRGAIVKCSFNSLKCS